MHPCIMIALTCHCNGVMMLPVPSLGLAELLGTSLHTTEFRSPAVCRSWLNVEHFFAVMFPLAFSLAVDWLSVINPNRPSVCFAIKTPSPTPAGRLFVVLVFIKT